jgi:hypothetical protein
MNVGISLFLSSNTFSLDPFLVFLFYFYFFQSHLRRTFSPDLPSLRTLRTPAGPLFFDTSSPWCATTVALAT